MSSKASKSSSSSTSGAQKSAKPTIWDQIIEHNQSQNGGETTKQQRSPNIIFVGPRASGKSTLMNSYLFKDKTDVPKPTAALDYKYARNSSGVDGKTVTHFWEIGGGRSMAKLLETPLTPETIADALVVLCIDLSAPGQVALELDFWLKTIRNRIKVCLQKAAPIQGHSAHAFLISRAKSKFGKKHPDLSSVKLSPVPIVVCGTKYDTLKDRPQDEIKVIARTMRSVTHQFAATLMFTSKQAKPTMVNFRKLIQTHSTDKSFPKHQVTGDLDNIAVSAGLDSFVEIDDPPAEFRKSATQADNWKVALRHFFKSDSSAGRDDTLQALDLLPEPLVDSMHKQKLEELKEIRRQQALQEKLAAVGKTRAKSKAAAAKKPSSKTKKPSSNRMGLEVN